MLCNGQDVIQQYQLLNESAQKSGREGIPHPATFIIDKNGVVRFKNVWVNYRQRTPVGTLLEELDKLE